MNRITGFLQDYYKRIREPMPDHVIKPAPEAGGARQEEKKKASELIFLFCLI